MMNGGGIMNKPLIYLASPYSPIGNYSAAESERIKNERFKEISHIAAMLTLQGHHILAPISMNHPWVENLTDENKTFLKSDWLFWQEFDIALIEKCDELWVATMEGWKDSVGVNAEINIAKSLNLPIRYVNPKTYKVNTSAEDLNMSGTKFDQQKPEALYYYTHPKALLYFGKESNEEMVAKKMDDIQKALINNDIEDALAQIMQLYDKLRDFYIVDGEDELRNVSLVSKLGATKYGIYNYQKGLNATSLFGAINRHFYAFLYGNPIDNESGVNHIYHILANLLILTYNIIYNPDTNDFIGRDVGKS